MSVTKQEVSNRLMEPILFNTATSNQGAKVMIRKIIPIAIASILYQRTDIDKNNFVTHELHGTPYFVFKNKLKVRALIQIRNWIKGILDAFDKNYLKEIYLLFCNINDDTDVKETYTFTFKYFDSDMLPLLEVAVKEETVEPIDFLLKAINELDSFTKLKQEEVIPYFALTYYPDVTPMEYEPPFYGGKDARVISIMTKALEIEKIFVYLGVVHTKSCRVKCLGKGKFLAVTNKTSSEYTSTANVTNVDEDRPISVDDDKDQEQDEDFNESMNALSDGECIILSDGDSINNINKIQCRCNIAVKFKNIELIECSECYVLQHLPCKGYLFSETIPKTNFCDCCNASSFPSPGAMFSRQTKSIYYLAVAYAFFNTTFPDEVLDRSSQKNKDYVVDKLLQVKCIKLTNSGYCLDAKLLESTVVNKLFPSECKAMLPDSTTFADYKTDDYDNDSINLLMPKRARLN